MIFVGGTMDRHMRALDITTGDQVWSDFLPNSAQATPMSYVAPQSGRQFVVITIPATGREEARHVAEPRAAQQEQPKQHDDGGWVIAYALPK